MDLFKNSFPATGDSRNERGFAITKENILLFSNGGKNFYEFVISELKIKPTKKAFENCRNPFYEDNNPSLSIYQGEDNNWYFIDFGDEIYKGDVFDFAALYYQLCCTNNFKEILLNINRDLQLDLQNSINDTHFKNSKQPHDVVEDETYIGASVNVTKRKQLTNIEEQFFEKYGIDRKVLKKYKVSTLKDYINNAFKRKVVSEQNPIIAYQISDSCYKLYKPYEINQDYKFYWLGKKPADYQNVYGIDQLPENCDSIIITEGYKDCLTIVSNYAHKKIYAVGLDQAGTRLSADTVAFLKGKCNHLLLCLDIDEAGINASERLMQEHGINRIVLPKELLTIQDKRTSKPFKDVSDYIYLYRNEPFKHGFLKNNGLMDLISTAIENPLLNKMPAPKQLEVLKKQSRLDILMHSKAILKENKRNPVTSSRPLITRAGDSVIFPNTINVIQGKSGVHKSRLAEMICSCLLTKSSNYDNFLGFKADPLKAYSLCLVDTERNMKEQLPFALQRIQTKAGFTIEEDLQNFDYVSLLDIEREERLQTIGDYLDYIRLTYSNHIFIVLDVITDCISNFNDPRESSKIIDLMIKLINRYDVTFLCIIHENPGSADKARGHLGTEIFNKATTVIQIGFEKDSKQEDTEILKVKYLKCRSTAKLQPFYIRYSEEDKGLILANDSEKNAVVNSRKKKALIEDVKDNIEKLLYEPMRKQEFYEKLMNEFDCSNKLIDERLEDLSHLNPIFTNRNGKPCTLIKEQIGREVIFRLKIQDPEYKEQDS